MKTLFLKNMMPIAVIALGISGAFVTTSMQSATKTLGLVTGYTLNAQGDCDIPVSCEENHREFVCKVDIDSGAQAYGKDALGNCTQVLYRPE